MDVKKTYDRTSKNKNPDDTYQKKESIFLLGTSSPNPGVVSRKYARFVLYDVQASKGSSS